MQFISCFEVMIQPMLALTWHTSTPTSTRSAASARGAAATDPATHATAASAANVIFMALFPQSPAGLADPSASGKDLNEVGRRCTPDFSALRSAFLIARRVRSIGGAARRVLGVAERGLHRLFRLAPAGNHPRIAGRTQGAALLLAGGFGGPRWCSRMGFLLSSCRATGAKRPCSVQNLTFPADNSAPAPLWKQGAWT